MMRIVKITGITNKRTFTVEDVFTAELLTLQVSAKQLMYLGDDCLVIDNECVAQFSPYEPTRGKIVTPSDFKMDNHNGSWIAQDELATRYTKEIGPYETDSNWFHRPSKTTNTSKKSHSDVQDANWDQQIKSKITDLLNSIKKGLKS